MNPPAGFHQGHGLLLLLCSEEEGADLISKAGSPAPMAYYGAMICDWAFRGCLRVVRANEFVLSPAQVLTSSEREAMSRAGTSPLSMQALLFKVRPWSDRNGTQLGMEELKEWGLVQKHASPGPLGFLRASRWSLQGDDYVNRLKEQLLEHLRNPGDSPHPYDGLLGLLDATDTFAVVFPDTTVHSAVFERLGARTPIGGLIRRMFYGDDRRTRLSG